MAQLNIRGQVLHAPGPWGNARPAAGVSLAIVDEDVGNAADTIWTGSTNAQGQYAGTTRDWRDMRTVTVATPGGPRSAQVADAADLMLLKATASQRVGSRLHSLTVPFVPAPAGLPQPPIVLGWGPPGLTRVRVNGVAANTLSQIGQLIEGVFGVGSAVAQYQVRKEIVVVGEHMDLLRQALADLEPELRSIETRIRQIDTGADGQRLRQQQGMQGNMQANGARAVAAGVAVGRSLNLGAPAGPDPWAPIRQRLQALPDLLAQRLRQRLGPRDLATGCKLVVLAEAVLRHLGACLVMVLCGVVGSADAVVGASVGVATGGPLMVAGVVTALVGCVVAVVQSLPALMAAMAMLMRSAGLTAASAQLMEASAEMSEFLDQGWMASTLAAILCVCIIVMLIAALPAAGWSWAVEQITGENGLAGVALRLMR